MKVNTLRYTPTPPPPEYKEISWIRTSGAKKTRTCEVPNKGFSEDLQQHKHGP